jgi:hypothetical protein
MSEVSRRESARPIRAAWLSLPLAVAASWALAGQFAAAAEPDPRMAELERRLSELEGRLLASEGESAQAQDSAQIIAALERRVKQLEGKLRARGDSVQIRAPLEVTDAGGNVVLRVGGDSVDYAGAPVSILSRSGLGGTVALYRNEEAIVQLGASAEGNGKILALGADGSGLIADGSEGLSVYAARPGLVPGKVAQLSASPRGTGELTLRNSDTEIAELGDFGLRLWDPATAGQPTAQLGPGPRGNTALRIFNPAGTPVAALGVEPDRGDSGALVVGNSQGIVNAAVLSGERAAIMVTDGSGPVAQLTVDEEGGGVIQVLNAGVSVAALTKAASGGMLQLASDEGVPMVEAGVRADGLGTVRTGPKYLCAPAAGVLNVSMPDCLVGRR